MRQLWLSNQGKTLFFDQEAVIAEAKVEKICLVSL